MTQIADLSMEELEQIITRIVNEKMHAQIHGQDTQATAELLNAMRKNLWKPPDGAKSSLELLREDRDR